jgi:hypothetical protein
MDMAPQTLIPLISVGVALVIILLRNRKPRPLRVRWMWIRPLIIVLAIGLGLWGMTQAPGVSHAPFGASGWAVLAVGLVLGGVAGWWRGKMVTIQKAPGGTLLAQSSPLGLILFVGLLASRQALRPWMESHAASWHIHPLAIQDAFMLFVLGLILMQSLEMVLRARTILAGGTDEHVEETA